MSPKRLRKIAVYLEWIAFNLRKDADDAEARTVRSRGNKARPPLPENLEVAPPMAPAEVPSRGDEGRHP